MRIFVTGATGWIGSAVVDDLVDAGHAVAGLARSDAAIAALSNKGVAAVRGDLDDVGSLGRGAADADAVVHLANKHDWTNPSESNRSERAAVAALAESLRGTDRPFVVASGLSGLVDGRPAVEGDPSQEIGPDSGRGGSENLALDYVGNGVRTVIVRFAPTVHGPGDWGFVNELAKAARERGTSAYIDDGSTQWSAVHRSDAARLVRLALERGHAGAKLHAVAEESVTTRAIAEALGGALGVPVRSVASAEADAHFGFVARFFGLTMTATSDVTRAEVGWVPTEPGLIDDIAAGAYGTS